MVGGEEKGVRRKSEGRKRLTGERERERERKSAGGLMFNVINEL